MTVIPNSKPSWIEHALLFIASGIAIIIDQFSKRWVEAYLPLGESIYPIRALEPYLGLTHAQNRGAAFSLFPEGGIFFIIVAAIVSGIILYYAPRLPKGSQLMRIALGLQLGGALGNVIDRLRQGYVTDMLQLQIPELGFYWPISNLADVFIVSGVILLILGSLRKNAQQQATNDAAGTQPEMEKSLDAKQP